MDKYYVIVAGSGSTSRANLEALMEDHFYAHVDDGVVVLPYRLNSDSISGFDRSAHVAPYFYFYCAGNSLML